MALVPIQDKPGYLRDNVTGEIINISQWREDDKYDTTAVINGNVDLNHELIFFRDVEFKSKLDTNLKTSRKIPEGERMRLERIGLQIPLALGNTVPTPADIKKMAENGYLICQLNSHDIAEGPGIKFPSGYGLAGQTVETDAGIVSIGTPATAAAQKLAREQQIGAKTDLDATYTFHKRTWATTTKLANGLGTAAGAQTPNFAGDLMLRLFFHGLVQAAATQS